MKNFNDFAELLNNKDWSLVANKSIKGIDFSGFNDEDASLIQAITAINNEHFIQLLNLYHKWLHS